VGKGEKRQEEGGIGDRSQDEGEWEREGGTGGMEKKLALRN